MTKTKKDYLNVAIIMSRLDNKSAYFNGPPMSLLEEHEARRELREGLRQLSRSIEKPDIILAPELSAPRAFITELKQHAKQLGAICIFGFDYKLDRVNRTAKNEIIIIIPNRWPCKYFNGKTYQYSLFKSNPAPGEAKALNDSNWKLEVDSRLWLFKAGSYGNFGIAICYDFLDVEMHLLYKTKIHHLFVLSYNKDVPSFHHTAESLCRNLFCNVVICNTGFYGGSISVAPYHNTFDRVILKNEGSKLFSTHLVKLPIKCIDDKQKGKQAKCDQKTLKSLPPRFDINK